MRYLIILILFSQVSLAENKNDKLIIQCQSDNPDKSFLKPIYEINFKTNKVKVGGAKYFVNKVTEDEIMIYSLNPVVESRITFNRINGKYYNRQTFFSDTRDKKDEKTIQDTGQCVKIEKAF